MTIETEYVFRADWRDEPSKPVPESGLRAACRLRLPSGQGPWRNWVTRIDDDGNVRIVKEKGPWKSKAPAVSSWARLLRDASPGHRVHIEPQQGAAYSSRAIKIETTSPVADKMSKFGMGLFGAPYVFGDLDCSGFVLRVVEFGVPGLVLPHSAAWQQVDDRVARFNDNRLVKRMDLVFMWYPNDRGISMGTASHVGFYWKTGVMMDTRSPSDPVGFSSIESGSWLGYGRLSAVNGPF